MFIWTDLKASQNIFKILLKKQANRGNFFFFQMHEVYCHDKPDRFKISSCTIFLRNASSEKIPKIKSGHAPVFCVKELERLIIFDMVGYAFSVLVLDTCFVSQCAHILYLSLITQP